MVVVTRDELVKRQSAVGSVFQQLETLLGKLLRADDLVQGLLPLRDGDGHVVATAGENDRGLGDVVQDVFDLANLCWKKLKTLI